MIKVIDGDLFSTKAKFIAHQVNCQGVMGSGVALQVRKRFPHVYDAYLTVYSTRMLGKIQIVPTDFKYIEFYSGDLIVPHNEQFIVNMFAQDKYGYDGKMYTSIEALEKCFKLLKAKTMEKNSNFGATIAMPYKIGCVRGGANWDNVVFPMIEEIFQDCNVELWRLNNG